MLRRRFGHAFALMTIGLVGSTGLSCFSVAAQGKAVEINLVSFAAPTAALEKIIPKFAQKWQKETGETVKINTSYGGSGSQTRAIIDGLEADIAFLAIPIDMQRLEKVGLVKKDWENRLPNGAIVTRSVIVFATRPGNPKNIRTWADLAKPGVRVVTANPKTSGVARWNFLGLWGSVIGSGGGEAQAKEYVTSVYRNVPILPKDAREATDIFLKRNQGDVLLNYENELILADQQGQRAVFSVPSPNLAIDNPLAVVDKNVDKRGTRREVITVNLS